MVQAAVADPTARKGAIAQGPWPQDIDSYMADGALAAGNLVTLGTDPETQVSELAALPAADDDAIATAAVIASAAAAQTINAGTFDGVIGRDRIGPARAITMTFDASGDWMPAAGELLIDIYGIDANGAEIKDQLAKAAAGAETLTTALAFAAVRRIDIGAGSGAAGTATVGVSNAIVEYGRLFAPGLACYEAMKEPNTDAREFADEDEVSVLTRGRIYSQTEHAVTVGDDVYVRVAAAGTDLRGQLTGQDGADTPATYARVVNMRWASSGIADSVQTVEVF